MRKTQIQNTFDPPIVLEFGKSNEPLDPDECQLNDKLTPEWIQMWLEAVRSK